MELIEKFYVTQIIVNQATRQDNLGFDTFIIVNPNTPDPPPTFDKYEQAAQWIKDHGKKGKWYQIQKFLMPH